tara:strand:- start:257 stop:475 length:219 start_codon:yes stop_codon:yes gene_type:complete
MKKHTLLKIVFGIISFIIGGIINVIVFLPILMVFIKSETILDILSIAVNIIIAVLLYRLAVRFLLNKNTRTD